MMYDTKWRDNGKQQKEGGGLRYGLKDEVLPSLELDKISNYVTDWVLSLT